MNVLSLGEFPNSRIEPFYITSPETYFYNCIAWACEDYTKFYWPDSSNLYYWPEDVPREENIEAFIELFKKKGYEVCTNGSLETNWNKIAIFCKANGAPTHAARQLKNGYWTSKLGASYDVTHSIASMQNGYYGNVAIYMKREKKV
jgi:hypothetical protein